MSQACTLTDAAACSTRVTAPPPAPARWAGVVSLAAGVFGLVTAEFLPASVLTPMAADLGASVGAAGQTVTATAVVGAIAGPTMAIVTRRVDRRLVLWGFTAALILSCVLAAVATNLPTLLAARVLLGAGLGGFWSMMAAMALRLVPEAAVPRAMAVIFAGVSLATVCAAPIGAYVGDLWGWRAAFWLAAGVGVAALAVQAVSVPPLPPLTTPSLGRLVEVMRQRNIRIGLVSVLLFVSGHFAGFTYLRPFLESVPHFGIQALSAILLAYGVGGFFGNIAIAPLVARNSALAVATGSAAIAATALALALVGSVQLVAIVAVTLWGFAFGALPVAVQTWMVRAAPEHAESTGGLIVTAFQVAIAGGAVIGGVLVDGFGALGAMTYAALATLAAAGYIACSRRSLSGV